jgi:hypothetical protein
VLSEMLIFRWFNITYPFAFLKSSIKKFGVINFRVGYTFLSLIANVMLN